jgi:hypothetical protein
MKTFPTILPMALLLATACAVTTSKDEPSASLSEALTLAPTCPAPATVTTGATGLLAADANDVYFYDAGTGSQNPGIYACAAGGCTQPTLVHTANPIINGQTPQVAVDANYVYWSDGEGIRACRKTGCNEQLGQSPPTLLVTAFLDTRFTVDAQNLYFVGGVLSGGGPYYRTTVMKCTLTAALGGQCTNASATPLIPTTSFSSMSSDGTNVYLGGESYCSVNGCTSATPLPGSTSASGDALAPSFMKGNAYYWAAGAIYAYAPSTATSSLVATDANVQLVTANANGVYWVSQAPGVSTYTIRMCPLTGCGAKAPTTVGSMNGTLPDTLVSSGKNVLWADASSLNVEALPSPCNVCPEGFTFTGSTCYSGGVGGSSSGGNCKGTTCM